MYKNEEESARTDSFKRNESLEDLLMEVNQNLFTAEINLLSETSPKHPLIFIVGPHRSGSTLMLQWLASLGSIAYPTNLMSRFFKAPIIAAKIQLLLTDEKYNYRNEIRDFNSTLNFESDNGKTKGALSPNEFWYFWRRFLPYGELDFIESDELRKVVDTKLLQSELFGMINVFDKPFALKAMILNYNIDFLSQLFDKAIFLYTKRDPISNIESALNAREKQLGSINEWYSFKIPEYEFLHRLDPYEQVAGQIFFINQAIEKGLSQVEEDKKIIVNYEDFCKDPGTTFNELKSKLSKLGSDIAQSESSGKSFTVTRDNIHNPKIINAYQNISMAYGN